MIKFKICGIVFFIICSLEGVMDVNHPVAHHFAYWLNILRKRYNDQKDSEARYALVRHERLMALWEIPIPPPPF